jgi:elongation factor G
MKMELLHRRKHGDIVGDINRRRGQVNDMGDRAGAKLLRQMCHYQKWLCYDIRTLSSGRATSTMEFSHYAETPSNISEAVIKKSKKA